jgi:hypothetical protein
VTFPSAPLLSGQADASPGLDSAVALTTSSSRLLASFLEPVSDAIRQAHVDASAARHLYRKMNARFAGQYGREPRTEDLPIGWMLGMVAPPLLAIVVWGPAGAAFAITVLSGIAAVVVYLAGRSCWHRGYTEALVRCAFGAVDDGTVKAVLNSRRMAINLPRHPVGEGYLYVVAFDTGTVKVGQTEDPRRRLPNHLAEAAAFGVKVVSYWISPSHMNFRDNETRLINRCMGVSRRTRLEYFHEVPYSTAVGFARELTYHSARPGTATEGGWR